MDSLKNGVVGFLLEFYGVLFELLFTISNFAAALYPLDMNSRFGLWLV